MEPVLEDLSLRVVGITAHWDLDVVRSAKVRTVYAALDLLCHLTAAEAKMSSMCVQIILETRMMSLVHHAHAVVQSSHEWCMFQPWYLEAKDPFYKNAAQYEKLSQIGHM